MVWLTELIRNSIIVLFTFSWLYSLMGSSISFWMAWLIIPLIMEIIPAMGNFVILINRKRRRSHQEKEWHLGYEPEISLIIPVYNSEGTLYRCLESVYRSNYPAKKIHIILSNNESTDRSFQIFTESQSAFPEMVMTWVDAKQGKSKALNLALFNSNSKYIIHIDSDGILHKDALRNMIILFENDLEIDSVTGTVVVDPVEIEATERFGKRLLRKLEFFEYCQAFLAGRNFQAEFNAIYTMSGAFSAFRKSAILRTQLFNTDTVSEDTHLTFQLRETLGSKITICNEAIFFVDPIEGVNELYAQRQRWQMGEIEVIHIFMRNRLNAVRGMLGSFILRILIYDHTFAFPRMI
ncbi:MAG: TIGR03111 family XrtG-associated glycosyltransferase, partial [Anaerovoracaceae bacterium]